MKLLNTFDPATTSHTLQRLEKLTNETQPQWGTMNAAQMLAHVNVAYDLAYGKIPTKPNFFMKIFIKLFAKNFVVGEKPYPKNSRTAPVFLIADQRDFEKEKTRLINNIQQTEKNGAAYFEGRANPSFGPLTSKEWSNLFYKHLDHHFTQFGI